MSGEELDRESRVFTRYLIGHGPDEYVAGKYAEAHRVLEELEVATPFERAQLRFARRHATLTRTADVWARHFMPHCLLRRKLVLLLAILETSPATYAAIDRVAGRGRPAALAGMFGRGVLSLLHLAVGTLVFVPLRLLTPGARGG
jgi:hypothetical protein